MKVLYWKGLLGKIDLNLYQKVILQILAGDYKSADLEKLRGYDIFSARASISTRLLFIKVVKDGETCLMLVEEVLNHDYHKSKALRNPQFLKYCKREGIEIQGELIFDKTEASPFKLELENPSIEFVKSYWCDEKFIFLNAKQGETHQILLPGVIFGPPGGGKSCLALTIIEDRLSQCHHHIEKPFLYLTESPFLLDLMRDNWKNMVGDSTLPVEFKSWSQVIEEACPQIKELKPVGEEEFKEWLTLFIKDYKKIAKVKGMDVSEEFLDPSKFHRLYLEMKLIVAFKDKPDDYYTLGKTQSEFTELVEKQWLYQATMAYLNHLQDKNQLDPAFYIAALKAKYQFIVVDEAQDLSILQLIQLSRLAENEQIVFCLDTHQITLANPHILALLFHCLNIKPESRKALSTTFRCSKNVLGFANVMLAIIYQLTGGKVDKEEYIQVAAEDGIKEGQVQWIESLDETMTLKLQKAALNKGFAVIVPDLLSDENIEKVKQLFNTGQVLRASKAKGLEFDTVVLYEFFNQKSFNTVNKLIDKQKLKQFMENPLINRSKEGLKNTELLDPLQQVYIAGTRAKESLLVFGAVAPENNCLIDVLKEATATNNEKMDGVWEEKEATSLDEWLDRVREFIRLGSLQEARDVFMMNTKQSREAFDSFYLEEMKKTQKVEEKANSLPHPEGSTEITPGKVEQVTAKSIKSTKKNNQFFPPAQTKKPVQTPQPEQTTTVNTPHDYVDNLQMPINFSEDNLKTLFDRKESFINKILFDTKDRKGLYLFQSIIANQSLFDVFYGFILKNKNVLGKISAKKLWNLFADEYKENLLSYDCSYSIINLIKKSPKHFKFLSMLIKDHPLFAQEVNIPLLTEEKACLLPKFVFLDLLLGEDKNKQLIKEKQILTNFSPLYLLSTTAEGLKLWLELINKNPLAWSTLSVENLLIPMKFKIEENCSRCSIFYNLFNELIGVGIQIVKSLEAINPRFIEAINGTTFSENPTAIKVIKTRSRVGFNTINLGTPIFLVSSGKNKHAMSYLLLAPLQVQKNIANGLTLDAIHWAEKSNFDSIFYLSMTFIPLFRHWIAANQDLAKQLKAELFFRQHLEDNQANSNTNATTFYMLAAAPEGHDLLLDLIKVLPEFAKKVSVKNLCVSFNTKDSKIADWSTPLASLTKTASGMLVLHAIFSMNVELAKSIPTEAWTKKQEKSFSALEWLCRSNQRTICSEILELLPPNISQLAKELREKAMGQLMSSMKEATGRKIYPALPNEIWPHIFRYLDEKNLYYYAAINKYISNNLKNILILNLNEKMALPNLSFPERLGIEYRLLQLQNKSFNVLKGPINTLFDDICHWGSRYEVLTAIAPALPSAQSKVMVERLLNKIVDFPYPFGLVRRLGDKITHPLYDAFCELGKNLNEGDCNDLAEKYLSASDMKALFCTLACVSKIDGNQIEKIFSIWWMKVHEFKSALPKDESSMIILLSDLALYLDKQFAKQLVIALIQNLSSHHLEIMKYSKQGVCEGITYMQALERLFKKLASRLDPVDLKEVNQLLLKGIVKTSPFDLTAELHLRFFCASEQLPHVGLIVSLIINTLFRPGFPVDASSEDKIWPFESDFGSRMTGYLEKLVKRVDEIEIEKLILSLINSANKLKNHSHLPACLKILLSRLWENSKANCHSEAQKLTKGPDAEIFVKALSSVDQIPSSNENLFDIVEKNLPADLSQKILSENDLSTPIQQEKAIESLITAVMDPNLFYQLFYPKKCHILKKLKSDFIGSINIASIANIIKILGVPRLCGSEIYELALELASLLHSQDRIPHEFYTYLFPEQGKQTIEQLIFATYFKLRLRSINPEAYIYCLDLDYQYQTKNTDLSVLAQNLKILSNHAQQEVLAILEELKDENKQQSFFDNIKDYNVFICFDNYRDYELRDGTLAKKIAEEEQEFILS